jgi:hypothetical protein
VLSKHVSIIAYSVQKSTTLSRNRGCLQAPLPSWREGGIVRAEPVQGGRRPMVQDRTLCRPFDALLSEYGRTGWMGDGE